MAKTFVIVYLILATLLSFFILPAGLEHRNPPWHYYNALNLDGLRFCLTVCTVNVTAGVFLLLRHYVRYWFPLLFLIGQLTFAAILLGNLYFDAIIGTK